MNADDPIQRRKTQVLAALIGVNLIFGALLVMAYPGLAHPSTVQSAMEAFRGSPLNLGYQLVTLVVCFLWLGLDSRQLDIRRPWWLNVGVVLLTVLFVSYYLYKTRPPGRRGDAILRFFGIVVGAIGAMMIGMFMALSMYGSTLEPATGL